MPMLHSVSAARARPNAPRRLDEALGRQTRQRRRARRRIVGDDGAQGVPAARVLVDEALVEQVLPPQHVQHPVHERDVGARAQRQVEIGQVGGLGPARIGHDDHDVVGRLLLAAPDALEGDRVAVGGVGSDQQKAVGSLEIRPGAGWAVGAQRARVADGRRGHAQARVGVEVVGAQEALGELAGQVVLLGRELPGGVDRHGVPAVGCDDLAQPLGGIAQRRRPRHPLALAVAARAQLGVEQTIGGAEHRRQVDGLGADVAEVGGVIGIALHPGDGAIPDFHEQAAANATVRAERALPAALRRAHASQARACASASRKSTTESRSQK